MGRAENRQPHVETIELYKNYQPPCNARLAIQTLLRYTPPKYLHGLKHVLLTNASALSHDRRRGKTWSRRRKVRMKECRGLYYQPWQGSPARIELFVDNIVATWPPSALKVPIVRNICFAEVLYHELGHHIHATVHPEHSEREDIAEVWRKRLTGDFVRRRYWYLWLVLYAAAAGRKIARRIFRTLRGWLAKARGRSWFLPRQRPD